MASRTASVDALPVFRADGRGEIFERQGEGAVGGLLRGDGLGLFEGLLHEELRRRAVVVQAGLQVGHDLREGGGNLGEARDVVVVVVTGVEGGVGGELGQVELQALVLVDGHLPLLEPRGLLVFDEGAEHELGGELGLMRKAGGVDGGEALDEGAAAGQGFVVRAGREVGELVVVALVAEGGGVLRLVAELVLPYLVEETGEIARCGRRCPG